MPSVLNVDTLVAANGTDPVTLTKQSAAKIFERHNASHSLDSSFGVSSITDEGVGQTTVTYLNALSSATQIISGSAGNNDTNECVITTTAAVANTTTTHYYAVADSGGSYRDRAVNATLVHGDLA
jgi:hypothetical protein